MRAKSIVLIMIALGCGLVASIGISQVLERAPIGAVGQTVEVFVARSDIDSNSKLTAETVRLEKWPVGKVPESAITKLEELEGRFTAHRMYGGELILKKKLLDSSTGDAQRIPKGFRVATVKVQVAEAGGGLVRPGDRVDIIAFLRRNGEIPQTMTKTILRNVRVFAVNAETERRLDDGGKTVRVKTLSLLVKTAQVESLTLAAELGRLRMSLRRPDDDTDDGASDDADIGAILASHAQSATDPAPKPARTHKVELKTSIQPATSSRSSAFSKFLRTLSMRKAASDGADISIKSTDNYRFKTVVITSNGSTTFGWKPGKNLPEEVSKSVDIFAAPARAMEQNDATMGSQGIVRTPEGAGGGNDVAAEERQLTES